MKKCVLPIILLFNSLCSFSQSGILPLQKSWKHLDNYSFHQNFWQNDLIINNSTVAIPMLSDEKEYSATGSGTPPVPLPYFTSITNLDPIAIGSTDTQYKPQAKTWFYAGHWWCAIPPSTGGTRLFRLDGTTWTFIFRISTSGSRADCWVQGNLVHILMYKGSGTNQVATLQYDPATSTYIPWSQRPTPTSITFPTGVETATLTVDGAGRMWIAADAVNDIFVWWSDAPYTTWSSAINVASGINSDDVGAVTKLPGKIGVFWSNQTTGLFGFKTHVDGTDPTAWSADERPASQSAIPGNPRMADDHMNLTVASDGTLYCAAKTSYNSSSLPQVIMLVRRPWGVWDNLYPVTIGQGTQAIVLLNETLGKLKVVYTTDTNGGSIVFRESSTSNISFGATTTLIPDAGRSLNFASSTHQTYHPNVAIIATRQNSPREIVSVLAADAGGGDITPPVVNTILRQTPPDQNTTATTVTFAVSFSEAVNGVDASDFTLTKGGTANGTISSLSGSGANYAVTITGITGTGSLRLDLNSSGTGIVDGSNNAINGGFNTGESYNVSPSDNVPPIVNTILRQSPPEQNTTATVVTYAVNFSEPVSGVDASDFVLTKSGSADGIISGLSGSGFGYTVTVNNITGTGSLRLDLKASNTGIVDGANNPVNGGFTNGETYNVSPGDATPPVVSSILRNSPPDQNTNATTVVFAVNFSEPVNGVDVSDFNLMVGGSVTGAITKLLGACSNYFVTVSSITGTGTVKVDLKAANTGIVDAVGNAINGGFTAGEWYNITSSTARVSVQQQSTTNNKDNISMSVQADEKSMPVDQGIQAKVYPNPFFGEVAFSFITSRQEKYTITLYDNRGSQVAVVGQGYTKAHAENKVKINGANLSAGLYMVRIETESSLKILKLIKE